MEQTVKPAGELRGEPGPLPPQPGSSDTVGKGDDEAHPEMPWKCSDGGYICCQGTRCCAWSARHRLGLHVSRR